LRVDDIQAAVDEIGPGDYREISAPFKKGPK